MILVDTSVWVAHLRAGEPDLIAHLDAGDVLGHPLVLGEIAMGNLRDRADLLAALRNLPPAEVATDGEVLAFIEREALHGLGIGYVGAHLLAAARLTPDTWLWTFDRRLAEVAERMGVARP